MEMTIAAAKTYEMPKFKSKETSVVSTYTVKRRAEKKDFITHIT